MSRDIPESDWKIFHQLHPIAVNRFCQQVLADLEKVITDTAGTAHERNLEAYELIHKQNRRMADAFDDLRRSTARFQIAMILSFGLLTEEEFMRFSPETREALLLFTDPKSKNRKFRYFSDTLHPDSSC